MRPAQSEWHYKTDCQRTTCVRIGAAYKCDISYEDIDVRERVTQPAASMPVVVPQKPIVLIHQFWCVDLAGEYEVSGRWRSKPKSTVSPLPENLSKHLQLSLD